MKLFTENIEMTGGITIKDWLLYIQKYGLKYFILNVNKSKGGH